MLLLGGGELFGGGRYRSSTPPKFLPFPKTYIL